MVQRVLIGKEKDSRSKMELLAFHGDPRLQSQRSSWDSKPGPLTPNPGLFPPRSRVWASIPTLVPASRSRVDEMGGLVASWFLLKQGPNSEIKSRQRGGSDPAESKMAPPVRIKQTSEEPLIGR